MVPDCWVELDRVYARWKCRFSPKAGTVSGMIHQTGPKKGPKGPSGMTHQTGPKKRPKGPSGMIHQTGPKKGPKGPSGMTHQTGPKKKMAAAKNIKKNLSRERGGKSDGRRRLP